MFRPLFTGSGLDAVVRCLGAATLPRVEERSRDEAAALAGVAEHGEILRPGGLPANLDDWLRAVFAASPEPGHRGVHFETSFKVSFKGDPKVMSGAYGTVYAPHVTGGTPDVFAFWVSFYDETGAKRERPLVSLRLGDLKTGAGQAAGTLPPPEESWQLRYYAIAVLLWLSWPTSTDLDSCEVAWFTRDYDAELVAEPELAPSQREHCWRITSVSLTEDLLLESVKTLQELTERLTSRPVEQWNVGPHCASCRGFSACPAQRSPIERLGVELGTGISAANIGRVRAAIEAARRLVEQGDRVVDLYVQRHGEVETRPGYTLRRERRQTREVTRLALPVLRESYPEKYAAMVRETASVGRIAEAMGEAKPGALTEAVLDKLRAVPGALTESHSFTLRERRDRTE